MRGSAQDVSDLRESPALDIIHLLEEKGARVNYHDRHVPIVLHDGLEMMCVESLEEALGEADCVVVVTDHSQYDWNVVREKTGLLVDRRPAAKKKIKGEC